MVQAQQMLVKVWTHDDCFFVLHLNELSIALTEPLLHCLQECRHAGGWGWGGGVFARLVLYLLLMSNNDINTIIII